MQAIRFTAIVSVVVGLCCFAASPAAEAGTLTVELGNAPGVSMVGAFDRWDIDGNHRRPVNPEAKIDAPEVSATAKHVGGGRWVFENLAPGSYDLVILGRDRTRVEGFTYVPVLEFDPVYAPDTTMTSDVKRFIEDDIRKSAYYENKVQPLYVGGDGKRVARTLVMLIRDQKTSYESHVKGAATIRFEVWQYDWQYGGWVKNKRTKVLHRILLTREELRQWSWLWDPKLGGIEVGRAPVTVNYRVPHVADPELKGLRPY